MSQGAPSNMEQFLAAKQGARRAELGIQISAGIGAVVLIVLAGMLMAPVNKIRKEAQIELSAESVEGLPPDIALLTKTGTLRALAIDIAFIRLEELKQNNRFYELMQLSDWLCKLAPRYASVWSYAAWNMAYNISVCQYTPEARWLWVSNGIECLRDQGIRYNPKSIKLYKELAWIFFHKIGDKLDDHHLEYKKELAVQMERILGEPALGLTTEAWVENFREIRDAPRDVNAWIKATPEAQQLVAELEQVDLAPDETLLEFVARRMRTYTSVKALVLEGESEEEIRQTTRRKNVLTAPAHAETARTLVAALRSQVLRQKLHMNVDWMLHLMEKPDWFDPSEANLLPIDWRSPFAHTLYWATYGDMFTKGTLSIDPADSMNAVRFIFFALENLSRAGELRLEPNFDKPNRSFILPLPDSRYLRHMHAAYLHYGKAQFGDDPRFVENTAGPNYRSGHINFLKNAIRQLYLAGGDKNLEEAKRYYAYLYQFHRGPEGEVKPQYSKTFDRFVFEEMFDALDTQANAVRFISELLFRSLKEASGGQTAASVAHYREARKWWRYYHRDLQTDRNTRRKLEPIGVMRRNVARQCLVDMPFSALQKARLWRALDLPTRQAIYDEARRVIERQCEDHEPPLDLSKVLPEPPGMQQHRAAPERVLKTLERFDETISEGQKVQPE